MKVALVLIAISLTSCSGVAFKDATYRVNTHIVSDTSEANTVVVDLRNKVLDPNTQEYIVKNNRMTVDIIEPAKPTGDADFLSIEQRLFWMFYGMMFLGLFGAGFMGMVDVYLARNLTKKEKDASV